MPRLYVTSASYPELREIDSQWARIKTWRRAFSLALRDFRLWRFFAVLCLLTGLGYGVDRLAARGIQSLDAVWMVILHGTVLLLAITFNGLLIVTWGGDLMRPSLRKASPSARLSCPACGYLMTSQLATDGSHVLCPECGEEIERSVFTPPFTIPHRYRATSWLFRASQE